MGSSSNRQPEGLSLWSIPPDLVCVGGEGGVTHENLISVSPLICSSYKNLFW